MLGIIKGDTRSLEYSSFHSLSLGVKHAFAERPSISEYCQDLSFNNYLHYALTSLDSSYFALFGPRVKGSIFFSIPHFLFHSYPLPLGRWDP